jgi:hypothetical protein
LLRAWSTSSSVVAMTRSFSRFGGGDGGFVAAFRGTGDLDLFWVMLA